MDTTIKFCKDCVHCRPVVTVTRPVFRTKTTIDYEYAKCVREQFQYRDKVTGELKLQLNYCEAERESRYPSNETCGPDATFFEAYND